LRPTSPSTLDHSGDHRDVESTQAFELQELDRHTYTPKKGTRESKRDRKRREKLEQLREADEMKFSHSLQFNAVPDWSNHYIAYSNLKKQYVPDIAWSVRREQQAED
jgi:phosphate transporter